MWVSKLGGGSAPLIGVLAVAVVGSPACATRNAGICQDDDACDGDQVCHKEEAGDAFGTCRDPGGSGDSSASSGGSGSSGGGSSGGGSASSGGGGSSSSSTGGGSSASSTGGGSSTSASSSGGDDTTDTMPYECPNGVLPNSPLPSSVDGHTDDGFSMLGALCTGQPSAGNELVYTFTSPADGFYEFTTTSTNMFADTVLYLLDETCDGEQLACGDESSSLMDAPVTTSNVAKYLLRDQVVQVVVDSKVFTGTEFTLTVEEVRADCIDEVITDPVPLTVMGDTTGRPNRMTGTCFGEAADYAFEWRATETATYQMDTIGSHPDHGDTVLYVLDGDDCAGDELACSDDIMLGTNRDSQLEVDLVQDQTVTIVVDGWSGTFEGPFVLNIDFAE